MGIREAPGLGRAVVPATGRVVAGGIDDFVAEGRTSDLATTSAGVEAARDLSAVSRLEGEIGAIDIFPGIILEDGFVRPPAVEAAGRTTRLVWAVPSAPNVLAVEAGAEGRVRPGRASEVVATVRVEVGGNDDLGAGGAIEVGLKPLGREGGPILPD